ncbi:SSU ribosomal protein S12P methylthiotransferase [Syntrophus gentianae]|uniref:Ribosomal protein uS12 methylthiotransferase RimO n=1 Tax=Syntrophus gentianae TaxID=43775 RepID=A0A1H7UV58_9BACT|nr:30S ribosomal protein S12 methylthiotransferase RimO [Syntrophus gentianae]SEM00528.1 SSU ribosomal protein S12P methylthiotransferase [Syntrophus gentianae]
MRESTVHVVSLGCPKNLVDSEVMAALLVQAGCRIVSTPEEAEILLLNTCAFILPAREESIDEIFRLAELKKEGKCRYLIVAGCLSQRYGAELAAEIPEVDLFLGISEVPNIADHLRKLREGEPGVTADRSVVTPPLFLMDAGHPRLLSAPTFSAYLKIADGCSNRCTYCSIPKIRGKGRSRPVDDLLREAEDLAERGVRELILIAQDTTAYGRDLPGKPTLALLLRKLAELDDLAWIRILYTYPTGLTDELFEVIAAHDRICSYLDVPIQHIDDDILKAMKRQGDGPLILRKLERARATLPDLALRTSLIVGFPGETTAKFNRLLDFVQETRFDHLGVFPFSPEEGTPAEKLPRQVSDRTKKARRNLLMEEQAVISHEINQTLIDSRQEVLIEGLSQTLDYPLIGRCRRQAPDIDGITYVKSGDQPLPPGTLVPCRIVAADDYDLFAEPIQTLD